MLYIRVDMNSEIATGHLTRCLSIAYAAKERGIDTTFILADETAKEYVESLGFKAYILHSDWRNLESEIDRLAAFINENNVSKLLVDTYKVTKEYLSTINKTTSVIYLDDLQAFDYPVDAVICYAIYGEETMYNNKQLYVGTRFFPARKVFSMIPDKTISESVRNVLVLSGGTDLCGSISRITKSLSSNEDLEIDAFCGMYDNNFEDLRREYKDNSRIRIHRSTKEIEKYMTKADIAISAGGTTLYELCACGTPTITYTIADNQLPNVNGFYEKGLMEYIGDYRTERFLGEKMHFIFQKYRDREFRKNVSKKMRKIVDGRGAERIVSEVFGFR